MSTLHSGCCGGSFNAGTQSNVAGGVSDYRWCAAECGSLGPIEALPAGMGKPTAEIHEMPRATAEHLS